MQIKHIDSGFTISDQVLPDDIAELKALGVKTLICNRPDNEVADQPDFSQIEEIARQENMEIIFLPVDHKFINERDVEDFESAFDASSGPLHAFCRSGNRSLTLWSLMKIKQGSSVEDIVDIATRHGYDFSKFSIQFGEVLKKLNRPEDPRTFRPHANYEIVIVGGGTAGISIAQSLLKRSPSLHIAIIDPAETHHYQPGFTMIGGGIFSSSQTQRPMNRVMPEKVTWIKESVSGFLPEEDKVLLENGAVVSYSRLVVCPGLKLDWDGVEGLKETLGKNGVTSNYHPEFAAYTWELVRNLNSGKAIFTQPPMPIKCAGAPQKALYLSGDHWFRSNKLDNINVEFYNAGGVLFGVSDYVPALQSYIDKYKADVHYNHNLVRIDGQKKTAWFEAKDSDGNVTTVETAFDMIHVCPPQTAPDFIRASALADGAGWVDVDSETLQHKKFSNIWSLGDVCNTPNAKTAAAVRMQVPVVSSNIIADINNDEANFVYNGYGSCPLTVERGKIVLAEFGYGGKLLPTFPTWLFDGRKPTWMAWFLKATILPAFYWHGMLKAHEWLVKPNRKETPVKTLEQSSEKDER